MTSWLDSVLARPILGILTRPDLARPQALVPLGNALLQEYDQINVGGLGGMPMGEVPISTVSIPGGYSIQLHPDRINLQYDHQQHVEKHAGRLATITPAVPDSYSALVDKLAGLLDKVLVHVGRDGNLGLRRIGVVADAEMAPEAIPPGIERFLEHLSTPWAERHPSANASFMAVLQRGEGTVERCHHRVAFDEDKPHEGVRVVLDWQRVFTPYRNVDGASLAAEVRACVVDAFEYFEVFGAGELDYVDKRKP